MEREGTHDTRSYSNTQAQGEFVLDGDGDRRDMF